MGFLCNLFGKGDNSVPGSVKKTDTIKVTTVHYRSDSPTEQSFVNAKCVEGDVYCCASNEFIIGHYEKDNTNKITVWDENRNTKIGEIDIEKKEIWLSSLDLYNHVKKMRPYLKMPDRFIWRAATWYGNYIMDDDTRDVIADMQGNLDEAAAGFVCLVYEVLMYNKYYDFYHGFLK